MDSNADILGAKRKEIVICGKHFAYILFLFRLSVILAGAAFILYPTMSPPSAIGGVSSITITTSTHVNRVGIVVSKGSTRNSVLYEINVWSSSPKAASATAHLIMPTGAWPKDGACPELTTCGKLDTHEPTLTINYPLKWQPTGFNNSVAFGATEEWQIPDTGPGEARNNEYISVVRPSIAVYSQINGTKQPNDSAVVVYNLDINNATSYTWDSGVTATSPVVTSSQVTWIYPQAQFPPDPLDFNTAPIIDSGTDIKIQDFDSIRLFISGVLLGTVGGALIAIIQELSSVNEEVQAAQRPRSHLQEKLIETPSDVS